MTPPFDHFCFLAPFYERFIKPRHPEKLISLANLHPEATLLDVGGGTGRVAQYFCGRVSQIILADQAFKMLQQAQKKPGLQPLCTLAEGLPFANHSFDRIIMVDALHHVGSQPDTAKELWRILKPGGRIIIEEPDIHRFGVKLVALAEKLAFMRSHFLDSGQISALFTCPETAIHLATQANNIWVVIDKQQ